MDKVLRVGGFGIKIIMLQIVPGSEVEVVKAFSQKLTEFNAEFRIFKALGHYDLLIFYQSPDLSPDLLNKGSIPYILKSNEILAFPWNIEPVSGLPNGQGFDFKKLNRKLVGLSFLKINPSVFNQAGTAIEEIFVRYGVEQNNISILGSFGWNEIILLVHENTFSAAYRTLLEISRLQVLYDDKEKDTDTFLLKTLSFLGINYSVIEIPDGGRVARAFPEKIKSDELFPRLYVTCCPQYMDHIIEDGSRCFGDPAALLGTEDISFDIIKPKTWGKCIAELIRFRLRNRERIFSSALHVKKSEMIPQRMKKKASKTKCKHTSNGIFIKISEDEIKQISDIRGEPLKDLLVNTIYTFSSLTQNEIARDSFFDMIKFVNETKRLALDESFKSDTIASLIDRIIFGAQQRASSTFSSIDNTEYRFSPFKGGIQRILQSIELLPASMLSDLGIGWKGFVSAGEAASFKADLLVLNIPIEYLFQPEEWWGLFHEIGHIYTLEEENIFDCDNPIIRDFMERVVAVKRGEPDWVDMMALAWEVSADIFDYQFGFNCDYETYHRVIWQYLKKYMASRNASSMEQVTSYVFRSLCVSLYDFLMKQQKSNPNTITQDLVESKLNNLFATLKTEIGINDNILSEITSAKVVPSTLRFRTFLAYLLERYGVFEDVAKAKSEYIESPKLAETIEILKRGQIYWGTIDFPEAIIYMFKKNNINDFNARIALILTFWHNYVNHFATRAIS